VKRLFLAVKISAVPKLSALIQNLYQELEYEKIRWVDTDNLHLTLKFFGETEESKIEEISTFINNIISEKPVFDFEISNLGVFGSSYQPKVIWLGIKNNSALIDLAETILHQLKSIGFERDRQNFIPHLTLGRMNILKDKERFNKVIKKYNIADIQIVNVKEVFLFESILTKEAVVYKVISTYLLKNQ